MKIILGSKSFGRQQVLKRAGYRFSVVPANIDEKKIRSENFEELPMLLARAKAKEIQKNIKENAVLITSDQVAVWNNKLREKPENLEQAREYLKTSSFYPTKAITAVVVTNLVTGKQAEGLDIVTVEFNPLPEEVITSLVKEGKVLDAAGGIIVEHPLIKPYIKSIDGELDSVTGLPLELTEKLIQEVSK